jgi:hypothetical protein
MLTTIHFIVCFHVQWSMATKLGVTLRQKLVYSSAMRAAGAMRHPALLYASDYAHQYLPNGHTMEI